MKFDKFVLAVAAVIVMAYFFRVEGVVAAGLRTVSEVGIVLIFFLYGLKIGLEPFRQGLKNWRLHVVVQLLSFVVFPLLVLAFRVFVPDSGQDVWLGFLFLAALPSTVSSSVVMVAMAGGNISSAVFNASISGLIGIVMTPFWMGFFLKNMGLQSDFSDVFTGLILTVVVPVIFGLFSRRFLWKYIEPVGQRLVLFDRTILLLLIYLTFVGSFSKEAFEVLGPLHLLLVLVLVCVLFFVVFQIALFLSRKMNFTYADRCVAVFCGSKKSLVHGTVFANILLGNIPEVGLIMLPLLLYHSFQIVVTSGIASRWGRSRQADEAVSVQSAN